MTSSARRRARRSVNWPVAVVVIVAIASALMAAGFALAPDSSLDAAPQGPAARASVVETTAAEPSTHITFGAHIRADMPCEKCHRKKGPEPISCNDCHKGVCGKSATSMADCIDCHKTGVTEEWTSEAR